MRFGLFLLLLTPVCTIGACAILETTGNERESPAEVRFSEPGVLKHYQAFYIEPVRMLTSDRSRLVPASEREIENLASDFRERIIHALGSKHTLSNQPALNVAIVKITVLDAWSNRALVNLLPGPVVPDGLSGGATMEARFYDSVSGREFGFVRDSRRGRGGYLSGLQKWDGVESAFDEWAQLLVDAARG